MKVKVKKAYRDKHTKEFRGIGETVEVSQKRFEQINSTAFGIFLEEIPEAENTGQTKTETKKPSKTK